MDANEFDSRELRICNVEAGGVADADICAAAPRFTEFLDHISSTLEGAGEALGRRYQRDIVNTGSLEIVSPFTAQRAYARKSFLVLGATFYEFCEAGEYYVAAARVKFGYPLVALYIPAAKLLVKWVVQNDKRGIQADHIVALHRIATERDWRETPYKTAEQASLVMGHKNFAHHLWNELPALESLLAELRPGRRPDLFLLREPLGPVDNIFPEIADWNIRRLHGQSPSLANGEGRLFVNLGSFRVSAGVRERVVVHARNSASPRAKSLEERLRGVSAPVFWVSVRTQTPKPTNQRDAIAEVGARLLGEFTRCTLLFDGFSPPEDWRQSSEDDIEFYRTAARESADEIDLIMEEIARRRVPSDEQAMVNLGGWSILDCIALAPLASCYFCHVGTVQHKIGWTTRVPGMIHANRRIISRRSQVWFAPSRLEDGVMPEAIDAAMVTGAAKEGDYEFLGLAGVAETVCKFFRACTSPDGRPAT